MGIGALCWFGVAHLMAGVMFYGEVMRFIILISVLFPCFSHAKEISQYICTIAGVYENVSGKLSQRAERKAIGKQLFVNADTGEVTGYFGSDGWHLTKLKRPKGMLTIETASGVLGDGANKLVVSPIIDSGIYNFVYTKNWLYISGQCETIARKN